MVKKIKEGVFKHHPRMEGWKKFVLVLPVLLSASWIFYLVHNQQTYTYYGMELLSPADTTPLIIALALFSVGYIVFLILMFSENLHDFIWRRLGH